MNESRFSSRPFPLLFFILAFVFSWFFWLFGVLSSLEIIHLPVPNMAWVVIGAHGPLFASLVLTYRQGGWQAVKELIRSGFQLRMKAIWWISILVLPFILAALAMWINMGLSDYQPDTSLLSQPLMILPTFLFMFFLGGSFQEEFGWRGYALPRMLRMWNPLVASLILGTIWGAWHIPLFYISGTGQVFMPLGLFILLANTFSILTTWFFLKTNRNLFSSLLLHTSVNTSLSVFPPIEKVVGGNQQAFTYLFIIYTIVILIIIMIDRKLWVKRST